MTHQEGPREFCAQDATNQFAQRLPGKRIQVLDGDMPGRVMKVRQVRLSSGMDARYQVLGKIEDLPEDHGKGEVAWTIREDLRVRILAADEVAEQVE